MNEYSATFKLNVIEKAEQWDNVSRAAREHDVSRRSVIEWMKNKAEIKKAAQEQMEKEGLEGLELTRRRSDILDRIDRLLPATIGNADRFLQTLKKQGTERQRKQMLTAVSEVTLWQIIETLEGSDWASLHPKDLSKIMVEVEGVRERLAGEPTVIIEERNKMKELVIIAARDLFGEDKAKDLVDKIATMQEAEYKEIE